ncbi:MAG: DNA methyltransferase, partial [Nitrospirae bacterium]|nr:DNA methyltransferase [Nitrospirota bacterium]
LPLHKTLVLLGTLKEHEDERYSEHERLALAKAIVFQISNLHFGPEVGIGPAKPDAPAVAPWLNEMREMADDLRVLRAKAHTRSVVHRADSRRLTPALEPAFVDAVITSPPYPNEKDYTRTTRLESVLLGFIRNKQDLRLVKQGFVRSNTRSVYRDDQDDLLVADHKEIQRIARAIEKRRIELGKTSGFERQYARVTKLYFGGMARHLSDLRTILRPGAQLAYVVGDQASYLRVMIRTGQLLAGIARSLGYEVMGIDLFRTRLATATKEQLREEVVLLRWPGKRDHRKAAL